MRKSETECHIPVFMEIWTIFYHIPNRSPSTLQVVLIWSMYIVLHTITVIILTDVVCLKKLEQH